MSGLRAFFGPKEQGGQMIVMVAIVFKIGRAHV